MHAAAIDTAKANFRRVFGGDADKLRVVKAPGRVNLIGEHVDYQEGFVLPMAIEPHVLVVAKARSDGAVRVASSAYEGQVAQFSLACITRGEPVWTNYVRGVAAELIDAGIPLCGADLFIDNTLPVGGGLSSSAAVLISVGTALLAVGGNKLPPDRLALIAQKAEHEFAGLQCGIMDQTIVAGARAGHAMLLDCRDLSRHFVPIDPLELRVVVANTMVRHELSESEYGDRVGRCAEGVRHFQRENPQIRSLRDVSMEMLESARNGLDPVTFRRCRHVIGEIDRARRAAELLGKRRYEDVGELMRQSHESLKTDYQVSIRQLDFLADRATQTKGVYGARMTGAGFGGCVVALVQPRAADALAAELKQAYEAEFGVEPTVFATTAAAGAAVIE